MLTIIIASLIATLIYLLFRNERQEQTSDPKSSAKKVPFWLLIGLLTFVALFSPAVRDKIQDLRKRIKI